MTTKEEFKTLIKNFLEVATVKVAENIKINNKVHRPSAIVVATWINSNKTSWYRKYSDGWIEQGGCFNQTGTGTGNINKIITFSTPFQTIDYFATQIKGNPNKENGGLSSTTEAANFQIWNKKKTSFNCRLWYPTNEITSMSFVSWFACGF